MISALKAVKVQVVSTREAAVVKVKKRAGKLKKDVVRPAPSQPQQSKAAKRAKQRKKLALKKAARKAAEAAAAEAEAAGLPVPAAAKPAAAAPKSKDSADVEMGSTSSSKLKVKKKGLKQLKNH